MYRLNRATARVSAPLSIEINPGVAASKVEQHDTRVAPVAVLAASLDLQQAHRLIQRLE